MNSPPSLCLSTCPRWCHINPPSRVTNEPPADAAPVLHRGSLTCAFALQTRLAGLLCGEAKTAPWKATGRGLRGVGTDLSCLKQTRSGLSLGGSLEHFERAVRGSGPGLSADLVILGSCFGRSPFRCSEEPMKASHHAPDRGSNSAYKSCFGQGSWLTVTMHFLTVPSSGR